MQVLSEVVLIFLFSIADDRSTTLKRNDFSRTHLQSSACDHIDGQLSTDNVADETARHQGTKYCGGTLKEDYRGR